MYTRLIEHFYLYCTTIPISSILHVQGGQIALVIPPQLARLIVDAVRDVVIDPLLARILVANIDEFASREAPPCCSLHPYDGHDTLLRTLQLQR